MEELYIMARILTGNYSRYHCIVVFCVFFSSGTEFVVVEDMSCADTSAIILKGTTVLTYKPKLVDRPFSGSLFGIEVRMSFC